MFDPNKDIPDLSDRIFFVTGGSDGLSYQTVLQLANHNPRQVYLACRSAEKTTHAIARIVERVKTKTGNDVPSKLTHISLDLSPFASIQNAAQTFL